MFIKDLQNCDEFTAEDHSTLRELIHPDKDPLLITYSLAHATVTPGDKTLPHRLKTSEVYYILEGKGIMHIDGASQQIHSHQAIYIPPNTLQYIRNTGNSDLTFLCIVNPPWKKEDEEILPAK